MVGKGGLLVTGQLGEVMHESARAALSYIRTRTDALDIDPNFQDNIDLHIHLPENAIPKDGPSAGITIATAIVSALTRRPVRTNLAMTGEITLLGSVLAIGGLKEKVLAAHLAHITHLIVPAENKKELVEIPTKIRQSIQFTFVETMDEVLDAALLDAPANTSGNDETDEQPVNERPLPLRDERLPHEPYQRPNSLVAEDMHDGDRPQAYMIPPQEPPMHDSHP